MIAHHLCHTSALASLKAGLKLDPNDLWNRIMCLTKTAEVGDVREAMELFKRLPPASTNRTDHYLARGTIEAEKGDYVAARAGLRPASGWHRGLE